MNPTKVSLIVEGALDEQVLRQLLVQCVPHLQAGVCHGKNGRSWMAANLVKYNQAANSWAYVTLSDLEQDECPPTLLQSWFPYGIHANLHARIAVRMVESWLLADREALAKFLGIATHHLPHSPDNENNSKQVIINLARHSRSSLIREDIVPAPNAVGRVGKNYRGRLEQFIIEKWSAQRAQNHSPSLQRAIRSLQEFHPVPPGY